MPGTAQYHGCGNTADASDTKASIDCAAHYIADMRTACCGTGSSLRCNCGDYRYLIASYNGGSGANERAKSCDDGSTRWECAKNRGGYQETYNYVIYVSNNYKYLQDQKWGC
jgi:soluble lytic murein transglycosylase-like protein